MLSTPARTKSGMSSASGASVAAATAAVNERERDADRPQRPSRLPSRSEIRPEPMRAAIAST